VSPNPNAKVNVMRVNPNTNKLTKVTMKYGMIKQKEQYDYCINFMRTAYLNGEGDLLLGVPEMNKAGNIHLHFLLLSPLVKNQTTLNIFRRDVMNNNISMENMVKGKDWMNNIVKLDKSDILEYMIKAHEEISPIFDSFYVV